MSTKRTNSNENYTNATILVAQDIDSQQAEAGIRSNLSFLVHVCIND